MIGSRGTKGRLNDFYSNSLRAFSHLAKGWLAKVVLLTAALLIFLLFRWISIQESAQAELSVRSVLRDEYATASSYQISRSLSDLESLNILHCAVLTERSTDPRVFYDTSVDPRCSKSSVLRPFFVSSLSLKAMNGLFYELDFEVPFRWQNALLEIIAYLFCIGSYLLYLAQKQAQEMREKLLTDFSVKLREQSEQVAHDIRSPLEVLEIAIQDLNASSGSSFELTRNSTRRIRNVISDLLQSGERKLEVTAVQRLIQETVREKQFQFQDRSDVKFLAIYSTEFQQIRVSLEAGKFQRVLSNLINNAFDSIRSSGEVTVSCSVQASSAVIEIRDTGGGMSAEFLGSLGRRGFSGRSTSEGSGHGLGFYFSKKCVGEWGGRIEVASKQEVGTLISVFLPCNFDFTDNSELILLDDDSDIHRAWQMSAKRFGRILRCYSNEKSLMADFPRFSKNEVIFIDSNLGHGQRSGEEVAQELYQLGFTRIYLATGVTAAALKNSAWIKGVVGKSPPWI